MPVPSRRFDRAVCQGRSGKFKRSEFRFVLSCQGTFPGKRRLFLTFAPCHERVDIVLRLALLFLVISLVSGLLGFTGISVAAAGVARILFMVAIVIFLVFLVLAMTAAGHLP